VHEVEYSEAFERQRRTLARTIGRFDQMMQGAIIAIANNPLAFPPVPGTNLRAIETRPLHTRVRLFYWIRDDGVVRVEAVEEFHAED